MTNKQSNDYVQVRPFSVFLAKSIEFFPKVTVYINVRETLIVDRAEPRDAEIWFTWSGSFPVKIESTKALYSKMN